MEGKADITPESALSWIFDGVNRAYDEKGRLLADIRYEKGELADRSIYYYPSGAQREVVPYSHGVIHGEVIEYAEPAKLSAILHINGVLNMAMAFFIGMGAKTLFSRDL